MGRSSPVMVDGQPPKCRGDYVGKNSTKFQQLKRSHAVWLRCYQELLCWSQRTCFRRRNTPSGVTTASPGTALALFLEQTRESSPSAWNSDLAHGYPVLFSDTFVGD